MFLKKFALPLLGASALAMFMVGCGDDSSTSAGDDGKELSSSSISADEGSSSPSSSDDKEASSSSVGNDEPSSTGSAKVEDFEAESMTLDVESEVENCVTEKVKIGSGIKVTCNDEFLGNILDDDDDSAYNPKDTYTDFVSIQKVFDALKSGEKVVFLLRHGDREKGTGSESLLTGLGKLQARSVGEKLKSDSDIFFGHSNYARTLETAQNVSIGRGQSNFVHKTVEELGGSWYILDRDKLDAYAEEEVNEQHVFAQWAYDGKFSDAFYGFKDRSEELISVLQKKFTDLHEVSVAISHDQVILPFAAYVTDKKLDLNYSASRNWLNFLAGVAMIVDADGKTRFVPVKGLDSGLL